MIKIDKQRLWVKSVENFFHCSSLFPMWFHYLISTLMFPILYWVIGYRKKTVRSNLEMSFPEKSKKELRQIERRFYSFFCDYIVETCKLFTISKKNIMKRMEFEGLDEMRRVFAKHNLAFLYLGHYGCWEWISSIRLWTGEDIDTAQLYRPLKDPAFDNVFFKLRNRFGGINVSKYDALRRIMQFKSGSRKTFIGFLSDQSPKPEGIHDWITFLNQPTPVVTGTERIAKKVKAAIFYGDVVRKKRGHYVCTLRLMTDDVESVPNWQITEDYMRLLEASIRRQPELWLWTHKRWKHKDLAPEKEKDDTNTKLT